MFEIRYLRKNQSLADLRKRVTLPAQFYGMRGCIRDFYHETTIVLRKKHGCVNTNATTLRDIQVTCISSFLKENVFITLLRLNLQLNCCRARGLNCK